MERTSWRRLVGRVAAGALVVAAPVALTPAPASAATPSDLFFSEYIEGSSNNKALEIYNGTGAAVDLAAGGYNVQVFNNGATSANSTTQLSGTIAPGDVFVEANSSANATIKAAADLTTGNANWNGNDAVVLRKGSTILDVIGQIGFDPDTQWGSGDTSTLNHTLRRMSGICTGDPNGSDTFDPTVEWNGFAQDDASDLGSHTTDCGGSTGPDDAPTVTSVTPADGSQAIPGQYPTVTFSEGVVLTDTAVTLSCSTSGDVDVTVSGGPTEFTVRPASDLVGGDACTLTVAADGVSDVDSNDPPDIMTDDYSSSFAVVAACDASYTPIYDIQGSGPAAAVTGTVRTKGVVVADYEGPSPGLRGFYLQDLEGDGNPATSDGIFVFNYDNDDVDQGDVVVVSGSAGEFQDQTQVSSVWDISTCGSGSVEPTEVTLPLTNENDLEKYEGMLVTMPQTLSVTEHYLLGRFGQVTVSSGGRLQQPTNVVAPGPEANALQAQNDLNQLLIDDTLQNQNPDPIIWGRGGQPLTAENTLRGGDTVTGATGIMTYTWGGNGASPNAWRLRPLTQSGDGITFEANNPRPDGPPDVGGDVQVAGMNLLNYFTDLDLGGNDCTGGVSGPPMECRGAETQQELDRQTAKTVAAITTLDADVIGINEIENDGYGAGSTIQALVDAVNAEAGAGTYAYVDADAATGQVDALGNDAIKVGLLYKPSVVTPVGQTAALNTEEFVNGGDASAKNRPSLAQAWKVNATGGVFISDVNHLKSKGSACEAPDTGDGQGNCAVVRTNAVRSLLQWLDSDPTGTGDDDVLLVGDYNSYAKETPIRTLEEGGFTNLIEKYHGADAYSYVFDGQWGYLDQAMASETLESQVTGAADYHINADEPSVLDYNTNFKSPDQIDSLYAPDEFRISDHDPVVVGLSPNPTFEDAAFTGPLSKDGRSVKKGSTLPIKTVLVAPDGSTPTDVDPEVTVELDGNVVASGDMRYEHGEWVYLLRTGSLPQTGVTYTVVVHIPWNGGQEITGTFRLR